MSIDLDSNLETSGWDRTFLDLSSKMSEPFCAVWHLLRFRLVAPMDPKKFENSSTIANEVAIRILIALGALIAVVITSFAPIPILCSILVLGVASKIVRAIGFSLQKGGYTYIRGNAIEKPLSHQDPQLKVMSWNICGIGGGMSLNHGGVNPWRYRIDAIIEKIKNEDPDVLILQEVYDTALAEVLFDRLKSEYAHFFAHLGPNVLGSVGGGMVISKCALHKFSQNTFNNNKWTLNRGFASLEVKGSSQDTMPCIRIIGTHLIHGDEPEDKKHRAQQVAQIADYVANQTLMPTLLAGDLNIERDQEEGEILTSLLRHGYQGPDPTCTNRLVTQWDLEAKSVWGETIDYISLFKSTQLGTTLENCHEVKAFDESYNTKTALSDHHGLTAVIKGFKIP